MTNNPSPDFSSPAAETTRRRLVFDSLAHRQPATIPYDIRFTSEARQKLAEYYGDPEFESKLGNCLSLVRPHTYREVAPNIWEDQFGVRWNRTMDKDIGVVENQVITPENFADHRFPDPNDPVLEARYQSAIAKRGDTLLIVKMSYNLFERAWSLTGFEDFLMYMATDKPFVHALLEAILEHNLKLIENIGRHPEIDGILFGDDWGQQSSLLISPSAWREFIKPRIQRMYQKTKSYGKLVFIHCCGDIQEIFPDLIEAGLDVYNPFQPEVMDIVSVKKRYGRQLSFYGGISTQQTLPFGTKQAVKEEVHRLIGQIGESGGLIGSAAHAVPADAKPENVAAMIEAFQEQ